MSTATDLYRSRLVSYEELVSKIKSGNSIAFGTWMDNPTAQCVRWQNSAEDRPSLCHHRPASAAGEFLSQPNIVCFSGFLGPFERAARRDQRNVFYTPTHYSDAYQTIRANPPPDFLIVRAATMDERGFLNLSLASSWTNDALRWWFLNSPETKIVLEVNSHTPRVCGLEQFGNNEIHISQVHFVVEDSTH